MSFGMRSLRLIVLPATLLFLTSPTRAQAPATGVSLKISREVAPPGAIAQMKVYITEPKPITTGRAFFEFDAFSDIEGIALASGDSVGVAVVQQNQVALAVLSPRANFASDPDYPVLTIAGRVPAGAPVGFRIPMVLDPTALVLIDPSGSIYPTEVKDGFLQTGGGLSIGNVVPGSADVEPGDVVSIFGTGFRPDTRIRLKETALADVRYISPTRIDVVVAQPTQMHGRQIRAKNRDGSEVAYFAYQRTRRAGTTSHPILQRAVPLFASPTGFERHAIATSAATAGIAVQNPHSSDTFAFAEMSDANGVALAVGRIEIPANSFVVRSFEEIFGWSPGAAGHVTLDAVTPVQALGIDVDGAGGATPRTSRER